MAIPAWAIANTTDVMLDAGVDGNFTAYGTGAPGLQDESDFFIEGDDCESKDAWASGLKGIMHDGTATDMALTTNDVAMVWQIYHIPNAITDNSGGGETGMQVRAGIDDDANYWYFNVGDNLTLLFETWVPWVINWDDPGGVQVGTPTGTIDWIGGGVDISGGPSKGAPFAIDCIRWGRFEIDYTEGETADFNTFIKAEAVINSNANRWGCLESVGGTFRMQGFHSLGTSGTLVDFRDSDQILFIRDTPYAPAGFNRIEVINASSNIEWTNILMTALGTQSPGTFIVTAGAVDLQSCQFTGMGAFTFLASSIVQGTVFTGCGLVTAPGTDMVGSSVLTSTVAADASALLWNVNTDTDTNLDDMTFVQGSNAHHAIELGPNTPAVISLKDIIFTGFDASEGSDGAVIFNNSAKAIAITTSGTSPTLPSFKNGTSASTTVESAVDITINVVDALGADIDDVRVAVYLSSDNTELMNELTVSGQAAAGFTGSTPAAVYIRLRKSSSGDDPRYVPIDASGSIEPSTGLTATFTMVADSIA